jgi:hypothetical protein
VVVPSFESRIEAGLFGVNGCDPNGAGRGVGDCGLPIGGKPEINSGFSTPPRISFFTGRSAFLRVNSSAGASSSSISCANDVVASV